MRIGRYLWALITDHSARQCLLVFHPKCLAQLHKLVMERFSDGADIGLESNKLNSFSLTEQFKPTLDQAQYQSSIRRIKDYIVSGDCYQANFTQHFSAPFEGDLWTAYLGTREKAASPYSAFWQWPGQALLCSLRSDL